MKKTYINECPLYCFYRREYVPRTIDRPCLLDGYTVEIKRMNLLSPFTPAGFDFVAAAFCLLYSLLGRASRYRVLCIFDPDGKLCHRAMVFPKYFRFPFMGEGDMQIGFVRTERAMQGVGLASVAIQELLRTDEAERAVYWYITSVENHASRRVAEKNGFQLFGYGERRRRFYLSVFGAFVLTSPSEKK